GNCHVFVDRDSELDMAMDIAINAKTQRVGVCNAIDTLLLDAKIAETSLPTVITNLRDKNLEVNGCQRSQAIVTRTLAIHDDLSQEHLVYVIDIRVVDGIDSAISHINTYGSGHSEAIVTSNYFNAQKFLNEVDAAAVYVNASTRFTDGYEYGFGAEIGI